LRILFAYFKDKLIYFEAFINLKLCRRNSSGESTIYFMKHKYTQVAIRRDSLLELSHTVMKVEKSQVMISISWGEVNGIIS
jgi:uncharacterized protein YaaR (DUF327 family)